MTAPAEHQVIETHHVTQPGRRAGGYRRVYLQCTEQGCFRGHVDGRPASAVKEIVDLIKQGHSQH